METDRSEVSNTERQRGGYNYRAERIDQESSGVSIVAPSRPLPSEGLVERPSSSAVPGRIDGTLPFRPPALGVDDVVGVVGVAPSLFARPQNLWRRRSQYRA